MTFAFSRPFTICLAVGLSGCGAGSFSNGSGETPYDILPSLKVYGDRLDSGAEEDSFPERGKYLDFYTRVEVEGCDPASVNAGSGSYPCGKKDRYRDDGSGLSQAGFRSNYQSLARNDFQRFWQNLSIARTFVVRAETRNLSNASRVKSVGTLTAQGQRSDDAGESFSTEFTRSAFLGPFFKITSNAVTNVKFEVVLSKSKQVKGINKSLKLLESAVQVAAPGSSLLTSITQNKFSQVGNFADSSITRILEESITEAINIDVPMHRIGYARGIAVEAQWPVGRDLTIDHGGYTIFGRWVMTITPPRPSIFSDVSVCGDTIKDNKKKLYRNCEALSRQRAIKAAYKNLTPSRVLDFRISEDLTLIEELRAANILQDSFVKLSETSLQGGLAALDDDSDPTADDFRTWGRSFCRDVRRNLNAIGFNDYDAIAAIWALASSGSLPLDVARALLSREIPDGQAQTPICLAESNVMRTDMGLQLWSF